MALPLPLIFMSSTTWCNKVRTQGGTFCAHFAASIAPFALHLLHPIFPFVHPLECVLRFRDAQTSEHFKKKNKSTSPNVASHVHADTANAEREETLSGGRGFMFCITRNQSVEAFCGAVSRNDPTLIQAANFCTAYQAMLNWYTINEVALGSERLHLRAALCVSIWGIPCRQMNLITCVHIMFRRTNFPGFDENDFATKYRVILSPSGCIMAHSCHYGSRVATPRGGYLSYGSETATCLGATRDG